MSNLISYHWRSTSILQNTKMNNKNFFRLNLWQWLINYGLLYKTISSSDYPWALQELRFWLKGNGHSVALFTTKAMAKVSYVVHSKSRCILSGTGSGPQHRSRHSCTSHCTAGLWRRQKNTDASHQIIFTGLSINYRSNLMANIFRVFYWHKCYNPTTVYCH